jgi:hypothetical protein
VLLPLQGVVGLLQTQVNLIPSALTSIVGIATGVVAAENATLATALVNNVKILWEPMHVRRAPSDDY